MSVPTEEAVLAAVPDGSGPVEVVGTGSLAAGLRLLLASRTGDGLPAVIVDLTGALDEIEGALRRVRDLGTVVLAGPPIAAPVALDVYPDLHVRGLVLVGVPVPAAG